MQCTLTYCKCLIFLQLDGLIGMVDFLSSHLQQIIDNKNKIIEHLHQPFVGKPIAMDSAYHA